MNKGTRRISIPIEKASYKIKIDGQYSFSLIPTLQRQRTKTVVTK